MSVTVNSYMYTCMETASDEYAKSIHSAASGSLAESKLGLAFTLYEQGGVKITKGNSLRFSLQMQDRVISLLGITELTSQLIGTS